ncbi:MAG: alpha/beta hydrolase [Bacillota bacterium]|nr:alpha/beta hydrolase [Bacillota bacterium]
MENFELYKNNDLRIEGYRWPVTDPKCVMCIVHGVGEHSGRYERMAEKLNSKGIAVLSMDLRGHGKTTGKRGYCSPRRGALADIDRLVRQAQSDFPDVPIVVYGHSMGGNIGLDYVNRGNLNDVPAGFIISAPWISLVRKIPAPLYAVMKLLSKISPKMQISTNIDSEDLLGNRESVGDYLGDPLVHSKLAVISAIEAFEVGRKLEDGTLESNGGSEGKPVLMMHGTADGICSIEGTRKVAANMKENCEYIEWEGLCHEIHNGGPESNGDEVIEKIGDWIVDLCS